MNAVYLRNVPPTPANYAQRAGRAGRSGQAAVVVTYCASGSPHDQYFFERRNDMVAGVVRPPALDITNEELVRSHLHAVWLAEAKLALSPDIPEILDLHGDKFPLKEDVLEVISKPALVSQARGPMARVLKQILASDGGQTPIWMDDPDEFVLHTAMNAPKEFDRAFDRCGSFIALPGRNWLRPTSVRRLRGYREPTGARSRLRKCRPRIRSPSSNKAKPRMGPISIHIGIWRLRLPARVQLPAPAALRVCTRRRQDGVIPFQSPLPRHFRIRPAQSDLS